MRRIELTRRRRQIIEEHAEQEEGGGEVNLVPYLDIVTNIILFLMMTTSSAAAFSDIRASLPEHIPPVETKKAGDHPRALEDLLLTVHVSARGFTVATAGGPLYRGGVAGQLPTLPRAGGERGEYDHGALTRTVREIKDTLAAAETRVIITADPEIRYEAIVAVMDAVRGDSRGLLFPDVLLAAGVEPR